MILLGLLPCSVHLVTPQVSLIRPKAVELLQQWAWNATIDQIATSLSVLSLSDRGGDELLKMNGKALNT
jgi:hypothetical protein